MTLTKNLIIFCIFINGTSLAYAKDSVREKLFMADLSMLISNSQLKTDDFDLIQYFVEKKIDKELKTMRVSALACKDVENQTVEEVEKFFSRTLYIPSWPHLYKLYTEKARIVKESKAYSKNDKERHCYAGYLISKDMSFMTAIFSAYYKEALDISDCNKKTNYETADEDATILGAGLGRDLPDGDAGELKECRISL